MYVARYFSAVFFSAFFGISIYGQGTWNEMPKVEIYQLRELEVENNKIYTDPLRNVSLSLKLTSGDKRVFNHSGFYDGNNKWKIRFSQDEYGERAYEHWFTDDGNKTSGGFGCVPSDKPGRVQKNAFNPFWLGQGRQPKTLFKSFHADDRFFAANWDDPEDPNDGNARTLFPDWAEKNGYNMLAGIFGQHGEWPVNWDDEQFYNRYFQARFGHYPNLIVNTAGIEPFSAERGYKNALLMNDIKRIGNLIDSVDDQGHMLTVHNQTRASQFGCPFNDKPRSDMATIQGPKPSKSEELFSGLAMNHRSTKISYTNETLWTGNIYHPAYPNDRIRKNTFTILFSGSMLNFTDNKGISSTGFSGIMNLKNVNQEKQDMVGDVHNWFVTIPFHQMKTRQDLVKQGYCLANEGVEYYIYLDTLGKVEVYLDHPYLFESEWINAKKTTDIRKGIIVKPPTSLQHTTFETPADGDDWILHIYATKPTAVATGNFPDLAVDRQGNIHLVYNRSGLKYMKYDAAKSEWSKEAGVGCQCNNAGRSDPDVVVDSKGNPHVYCGNEYAWFDGKKWMKVNPKGSRDSELGINKNDQLFLASRGGNHNGHIGMETRSGKSNWLVLPDPDENGKSFNDHVYNDIYLDANNTLHLVQRHGPVKEVTYRRSVDGGRTWPIEEAVSDDRSESPHIVVSRAGKVFVSTGEGYVFERTGNGKWKEHGRKVGAQAREQPEFGIDNEDNLYLTSFNGLYNTFYKGAWIGEKKILPVTSHPAIGFVETAGYRDFAYIVWEEGSGHADEGLSEDASIVVGILFPDGRIIGLGNMIFLQEKK